MSPWRETVSLLFDDLADAEDRQQVAEMELIYEKYRNARDMIKRGEPEKVPAAERLLHQGVEHLADEICKYLRWQEARAGKVQPALMVMLTSLEVEILALITLRVMFSRVTIDRSYYAMSDSVGQLLYLEFLRRQMDKETQRIFKKYFNTPGVRGLQEFMNRQKTKGFRPAPGVWATPRSRRLVGFFLCKLAVRTLGIFDEERTYELRKTIVYPVFAEGVLDSFLLVQNNPSWIWTPLWAPMVCPPRDWTDEEKDTRTPLDRR